MVKSGSCAHQQSAHHGAFRAGTVPHCQGHRICRGASIPGCTHQASADGCPPASPRTRSEQPPGKTERSLQMPSTRFCKDLGIQIQVLHLHSTAAGFFFLLLTKMKIWGAYIMQPFSSGKAGHICASASEKQCLGDETFLLRMYF